MKNHSLYLRSQLLACSLFSILGFNLHAQSTTSENAVGKLPGDIEISLSGAAIYSVPIDLPSGRANMTPVLTLMYSSQAGNGLLGIGWNLGGLSNISRIGTNLYNEDFIDGVDFDESDRFSLDGKRLIPINEDHNEFRTELESFSKIITHGEDINDPEWFQVFRKDGLILEYGNTSDARIEAQGRSEAIVWQLNRIVDRQGNYIDYHYDENYGVGKLHSIHYTGNLSIEGGGTFYDVIFNYSLRTDENKMFISGCLVEQKELLHSIEIKNGNNIIKTYTIEYDESDLYPKIIRLKIQDSVGQELNSTSFDWGNDVNPFQYNVTSISNQNMLVDFTAGDFNGDGKSDVVGVFFEIENDIKIYDHWSVYFSLGNGIDYLESNMGNLSYDFLYFIPGDFNGDAKDDLAMIFASTYRYALSTGDDFTYSTMYGYVGAFEHYFKNVDLNGNGIDELLLVRYNIGANPENPEEPCEDLCATWMCSYELSPINGSRQPLFYYDYNYQQYEGYYYYHYESDLNPLCVADFNGDGKTDLLINTSGNLSQIMELNEITKRLVDLQEGGYNYPTKNTGIGNVGDFNGDGISDLFTLYNGDWRVLYFDGKTGWELGSIIQIPVPGQQFHEYENFKFVISDFNGDGKSDIGLCYEEYYWDPHNDPEFLGTHWDMHYSNGTEFTLEEHFFLNDNMLCYWDGIQSYDVNGDGKQDCFLEIGVTNLQVMYFHKNEQKYLIKSIKDGFAAKLNLTYCPLTDNDYYTKYSDGTYPLIDVQPAEYVINKIEKEVGNDLYIQKEYAYEGMKFHQQGRGNLGFKKHITKNSDDSTAHITEYDIFSQSDLYYLPFEKRIAQYTLIVDGSINYNQKILELNNNVAIKHSVASNELIFFPLTTESHHQSWDVDEEHSFIKTITTLISPNDVDMYGNVLKQYNCLDNNPIELGSPPDSYSHITLDILTYLIDTENWLLSRPASSSRIDKYVNDPVDNIVNREYTYYEPGESGGNGIVNWPLLKEVLSTPNNDNQMVLSLIYEYDIYGNIVKTEKSAPNSNTALPFITTYFDYDDEEPYKGRFLTEKREGSPSLSFITKYDYNTISGQLISEINPQGLQTLNMYDSFGRLIEINPPDNIRIKTQLSWSTGDEDEPQGSVYLIKNFKLLNLPIPTESEGVKTFFNKYMQKIRTVTYGSNDSVIYTDAKYDEKGRLWMVSDPYFNTESPLHWSEYRYDGLGRPDTIILPTKSLSIDYHGRSITTTDAGTRIDITKEVDALGRKVEISDPSGLIQYDYFSSGLVKSINSLGSVIEYTYDASGNQHTLSDPDAGTIEYIYNAYGLLTEQNDPNGNTYILNYDELNRLQEKILLGEGVQASFHYKSLQGPGYGMPERIERGDGIIYTYEYDELTRLHAVIEEFYNKSFVTVYGYSNYTGKLESMTYPSGLQVKYNYDIGSGSISTVSDINHNKVLWQCNAANARGQLMLYTLGNGLQTSKKYDEFGFPASIKTSALSYDGVNGESIENDNDNGSLQYLTYGFDPLTGNLSWRGASVEGLALHEDFYYDDLLHSRLTSWQVEGQTGNGASILNNGNIYMKSGITSAGQDNGTYIYGEDAGPHAVTSISNPTPEYSQHSTPQNIIYTAFNKVKQISQEFSPQSDNPGDGTWRLDVSYGPDEQRKLTHLYHNDQLIKTKYYSGNLYGEENAGQSNRKIHYLYGGDGLFAIYVMNGENDTIYYIHKDYLGSYDVITDENGTVLERLSFDPWGRRRNPFDWTFNNIPEPRLFDRGYTGHEHLDIFGLINMNGRVYDPWLGRFLSPDPFINSPLNSQSYNRYTYCLNNPLKYVDPSGYSEIEIESVISTLLASTYGGSWSPGGGYHFYASNEEALESVKGYSGNMVYIAFEYKIVSKKNKDYNSWKYKWKGPDGKYHLEPVYDWIPVLISTNVGSSNSDSEKKEDEIKIYLDLFGDDPSDKISSLPIANGVAGPWSIEHSRGDEFRQILKYLEGTNQTFGFGISITGLMLENVKYLKTAGNVSFHLGLVLATLSTDFDSKQSVIEYQIGMLLSTAAYFFTSSIPFAAAYSVLSIDKEYSKTLPQRAAEGFKLTHDQYLSHPYFQNLIQRK